MKERIHYTIGRKDVYDEYLKTSNPQKGIGGSVFKDFCEAEYYLNKNLDTNWDIYGVECRWGIDTVLDENGEGWHKLLVNCNLVKAW